MIARLAEWLDERGDLLSAANLIFLIGPAAAVALFAVVIWREVSQGAAFWSVLVTGLVVGAGYYAALMRAVARQGERRYQKDVRESLSSEYKNG
ncbi:MULTISPECIES: hypothetical protein [unclassified Sphingomonas]|uniref:hypothetical protein n=1 Tax=unclassified Sphingomonas TaxID=196159 RepID=UPI002150E47D|nr:MULTISPECIES: hypothetical protein [unclassified Sphingomonas]MCR5872690.1 hypothetical protein [Sphingomonas sp. J344]UUX99025.1 hypothetical protein LRS08_16230 [Sphingomonas sp. J315]